MPYMTKHSSGAIIFHRTPEEKAIISLQKENEELRSRLDKLEQSISKSSRKKTSNTSEVNSNES